MTGYDPDGRFLYIVAGAAIGALVSGGISYASQAIKNKSFTNDIDWNMFVVSVANVVGNSTGNDPSWSTVRLRYWKNEAHYNPGGYSEKDLKLMKKGRAPCHDKLDVPKELPNKEGRGNS